MKLPQAAPISKCRAQALGHEMVGGPRTGVWMNQLLAVAPFSVSSLVACAHAHAHGVWWSGPRRRRRRGRGAGGGRPAISPRVAHLLHRCPCPEREVHVIAQHLPPVREHLNPGSCNIIMAATAAGQARHARAGGAGCVPG